MQEIWNTVYQNCILPIQFHGKGASQARVVHALYMQRLYLNLLVAGKQISQLPVHVSFISLKCEVGTAQL